MAQLAWMLRYLPDIESDMSVFHRADDIYSMPGPRFFRLAYRLDCYRGAMRERAIAWQRDHEDDPVPRPAAPQAVAAPARRPRTRDVQLATRADLSDPVLGKILSFS